MKTITGRQLGLLAALALGLCPIVAAVASQVPAVVGHELRVAGAFLRQ